MTVLCCAVLCCAVLCCAVLTDIWLEGFHSYTAQEAHGHQICFSCNGTNPLQGFASQTPFISQCLRVQLYHASQICSLAVRQSRRFVLSWLPGCQVATLAGILIVASSNLHNVKSARCMPVKLMPMYTTPFLHLIPSFDMLLRWKGSRVCALTLRNTFGCCFLCNSRDHCKQNAPEGEVA